MKRNLTYASVFLNSWRPYAWIGLAASLLYIHIVTFLDYTYFDDYILIARNFSHIDELSDIGHEMFEDAGHQAQGGNLYRPILTITFILSAQLSGLELWGYHLVDVLLHAIACVVVFGTLSTLGFRRSHAFVWSLIFCVHPTLTQAVAWISGRNDPLLAIFILPCFIFFVKFLQAPSLKTYLLHLLFFAGAILTKETAVAFPLLAMFYAVGVKKQNLVSRYTLLWLVGWGIVIVNWQVLRYAAQMAQIGDMWLAIKTILSHSAIAIAFFGKIFWPFDLAFAPVEDDLSIVAGVVGIAVTIVALAVSQRRDWGIILFGLAWFGMFQAPTFFHHANLYFPPQFYEHRIYVPFIGILMVFLSVSLPPHLTPRPMSTRAIVLLLLAVLTVLSFRHSFDYRDSITLREYAARTSPNDVMRYSPINRMHVPEVLAATIADRTRTRPEGTHNSSQEVSLSPVDIRSLLREVEEERNRIPKETARRHALAVLYFARGYLVRSVEEFRAAIEQDARNPELRYNLGVLYYDAHFGAKAEQEWLAAIERNPMMADAHHNLCYWYYEQEQYYKARDHLNEALQLGANVAPDLVREIERNLNGR